MIDFQVRHIDHVGTEPYIAQRFGPTTNWFINHVHGSGIRVLVIISNSLKLNFYGGEITDNNWHWITLVKVLNEYGLYIDRIQTGYASAAAGFSSPGPLTIGHYVGPNFLRGSIDEIRFQHSNIVAGAPNVGLTDLLTLPTEAYAISTNPYPIAALKKNVISGYHCFMAGYMDAKRKEFDPLKLPDGTIF